MNRYGSRKFIVALVTLISAHWSLVEKLIDGATYKAVLLGIVAVYMTGNVGQKLIEARDKP